jgi:tetratricopeptide (TPR) repeat protein
MIMRGQWNDAVERLAELRGAYDSVGVERLLGFLLHVLPVFVNRGDIEAARELFEFCAAVDNSEELQARSSYLAARAALLRAEGRYREALQSAEEALKTGQELGTTSVAGKEGFVEAIESALAMDETGKAEELLERIEGVRPGERTPFLETQALRFRAKLGSSADDSGAEAAFSSAATSFRQLGTPFWVAVTLLEMGEWLVAYGRAEEAEAVLEEAREVFEELGARPWLDRLALVSFDPKAASRSERE